MAEYETRKSNGLSITIASGGAVFVIASIFWAGATYNRVQGIETQLGVIQAQISKLGDFQALQERSVEQQRRLDKLEDQVRAVQLGKAAQ